MATRGYKTAAMLSLHWLGGSCLQSIPPSSTPKATLPLKLHHHFTELQGDTGHTAHLVFSVPGVDIVLFLDKVPFLWALEKDIAIELLCQKGLFVKKKKKMPSLNETRWVHSCVAPQNLRHSTGMQNPFMTAVCISEQTHILHVDELWHHAGGHMTPSSAGSEQLRFDLSFFFSFFFFSPHRGCREACSPSCVLSAPGAVFTAAD